MKENIIKDKSYQFAIKVVRFYKHLVENKREFIIAKQVIRSGTSIGAMIEEANQAESKADFIHKLSVANKEANETHYWLRLLRDSDIIGKEYLYLQNDCEELIRLLTAIIKSTKANLKK
ncbi:MAG: four helix bundle protein [Bacteroidetes bacterium]|nr:MAG: four helix bundle protein [Bacteroidota bacterium]